MKFYILDVFAEKKYAGNQLAVVPDADDLTTEQMLAIAHEFNFSETTFVGHAPNPDGSWPVRIFTPKEELPFAGHPTLGTAFVIQKHLQSEPTATVSLSLKAGIVPVAFAGNSGATDELVMTQLPPEFGEKLDLKPAAEGLGIAESGLDDRFPIQVVSTGTPIIIAAIKKLETQRQIKIYLPKYNRFVRKLEAKAILTFCPETYDTNNALNARVFADHYGVPEDPATGSAAGCLAAYLVQYDYFDEAPLDIWVEQGIEIDRPSRLHLKAEKTDGQIQVKVGGQVIPVATGELL
jgi:trans-2,3-dihydro-3-hydroxyanthranilate isomerase